MQRTEEKKRAVQGSKIKQHQCQVQKIRAMPLVSAKDGDQEGLIGISEKRNRRPGRKVLDWKKQASALLQYYLYDRSQA